MIHWFLAVEIFGNDFFQNEKGLNLCFYGALEHMDIALIAFSILAFELFFK
jgi:hypothetical protein